MLVTASSNSSINILSHSPIRNLAGRHSEFRKQAKRFGRLIPLLFEFYYCEGPQSLLDAIVELTRAHFNLVAICETSSVTIALAHVADASFAIFELSHDLKALSRSIQLYRHLLDHSLALLAPQRSYITARLSYALLWRFKSAYQEEDCRTALRILEGTQLDSTDCLSQAWLMIVRTMLKCTIDVWSHIRVSHQDLTDMLKEIRNIRSLSLPRSVYILSLIVEAHVAIAIIMKTHQYDHLPSVMETVRVGLELCSGDAEILRFQILSLLARLHFNARYLVKEKANIISHLDASIELVNQARSLVTLMTRNIHKQWSSLGQRALSFMLRATNSDDLDTMQQAVDALKEAVSTRPDVISWRDYSAMVTNCSYAMGLYFEQTGIIGVLDELLLFMRRFVSTDMLHTPFFANNMAAVMLLRAQISNINAANVLINEAIKICQARKNSPNFAQVHDSERITLEVQLIKATRMQISAGDRPVLEPRSMLKLAQQTCTMIPEQDIPTRVEVVLAQLDALMLQAREENDVSLLAEGLSLIDQELASEILASSAYMADLLAARADLLFAQSNFEDGDDAKALILQSAWSAYQSSINATSGRARERFLACLRWANHAQKRRDMKMALKAYSNAIEILPGVVFMGEEVIGRIEALRQVNGLASASVSTALTLGKIPMAIDFLERTRGILWLQSFRATEHQLSSLPVALRDRFIEVSCALGHENHFNWAARRHKAEELGNLLAEVRMFPGLERFQLPPLLDDIQNALRVRQAHAVVIVPTTSGCDVIILGMDSSPLDASYIRLSTITLEQIRHLSGYLTTACDNARQRGADDGTEINRGISQAHLSRPRHSDPTLSILSELWTSLVHPILKYINVQTTHSRRRLWWCPIGALSSLPLHVAGVYEGPSADHIGNYVVSSYTPTLAALHRLLSDTPVFSPPRQAKVLLVAQTNARGFQSLPNAQAEIEQIKSFVSSQLPNCDSSQGITVTDALSCLGDVHVLHLACHGHQDQDNPLNSGFELEDGRLTLGQLMRLNMPEAQLAYLSACESAGMDESRPDEGLNLVGTMIFVGFRSVIGTMWAMDDLDGPFMAERIYAQIFKGGKLDLGAVPHVVDDAIRQLRESGVPASRWATYVHFGV